MMTTLRRSLLFTVAGSILLAAAPAGAQGDPEDAAPAPTVKKAPAPAQPDPNPGIQAPTIQGLTGLFRTVTTEIGGPHTFRIGLHTEAFKASDFLVSGDSNSRFIGTVSLSYTPWRYLEFFASVRSQANNNERPKESGRLDQPVILALGDLSFGAKGQYPIHPSFGIGANFAVNLLNSVGGTSFDGGATGAYFGMISSFDLGAISAAPLRFHLNFGYLLDNSNSLAVFNQYTLASLQVEKFALGMNPSRLQLRFGVDLPMRKWIGFGLSPIVEVAADFATGDPDPDFNTSRFLKPSGPLSAADIEGSTTAWMTVGLRANPVRGFNVELASDIGLASPGYGYGPPVVPWNIIVGLSYGYDPNPPTKIVTQEKVKEVVKEVGERRMVGKFRGRVINAKTLEPVEGAIVTLPGKDLTGLSTDPDGSFLSYELPPGPHVVMVRHPNFQPGKVSIQIKTGAVAAQDIKLEPAAPRFVKVTGRVQNAKGAGIAATVSAGGTENKQVTAEASGAYMLELAPGSHTLSATADGYLRKEQLVTVAPGTAVTADFTLSARPKRSLVTVTKKEIAIKKQVHFATNAATILPDSQQLLDSIVDVLIANPNIKRIEIGGHTDNRGNADANLKLSQERAEAVRDYLVKNGVAPDRLDAKGFGAGKPKGPNITPMQRARNRRVEFLITAQ